MISELPEGLLGTLNEFQLKFGRSILVSEPDISAQLLNQAVNIYDKAQAYAEEAVGAVMQDGVSVDFGKHSVSAHVAGEFFKDFFRLGIEQGRVSITRKGGLMDQHGIASVTVMVNGEMYCFVREIGFYHPDRPDDAVSSNVLLTFGPASSQGLEQLLQRKSPDGIRRAAEFLKRVSGVKEGIKAAGSIYVARQDRRLYFSLSIAEQMRLVSEALSTNPYTGSPRPIDDLTKGENDSGMPYEMCLIDSKDVLAFVAGGKGREELILRLADRKYRQLHTLSDDDAGRYQEAIMAIEKDIHDRYKKE